MPPAKHRQTKKGKRTAEGETAVSVSEGRRRTQFIDQRHLGYTTPGVDLTHLLPWARQAILGDRYSTIDSIGRIFSP